MVVFYNQAERKPHRSRYGLHAATDAAADEHMADVTALYLQAQALRAGGERVVSTDEMTGSQALERTHPPIPMGPGRAERREVGHIPHGPFALFRKFALARGTLAAPSHRATRTEQRRL